MSQNGERIPVRQALLRVAVCLLALGMLDFSVRSVARVWVDMYWQRNITLYDGRMPGMVAIIFMAAGLAAMVASFVWKGRSSANAWLLNSALVLVSAGNLGFCTAAFCQAALHLSGLVGPDGILVHPRSLMIMSTLVTAAGVALIGFAGYEAVKTPYDHRTGKY